MNVVVLMGRLTKDPEVRYSQSGKAYLKMTLAVNRKVKDANGNIVADFINCTAFGSMAEFIGKYFHKGLRIAVTGSLQISAYGQGNNKTYTYSVMVNSADFADGKSSASNSEPYIANKNIKTVSEEEMQNSYAETNFEDIPIQDDDFPF